MPVRRRRRAPGVPGPVHRRPHGPVGRRPGPARRPRAGAGPGRRPTALGRSGSSDGARRDHSRDPHPITRRFGPAGCPTTPRYAPAHGYWPLPARCSTGRRPRSCFPAPNPAATWVSPVWTCRDAPPPERDRRALTVRRPARADSPRARGTRPADRRLAQTQTAQRLAVTQRTIATASNTSSPSSTPTPRALAAVHCPTTPRSVHPTRTPGAHTSTLVARGRPLCTAAPGYWVKPAPLPRAFRERSHLTSPGSALGRGSWLSSSSRTGSASRTSYPLAQGVTRTSTSSKPVIG